MLSLKRFYNTNNFSHLKSITVAIHENNLLCKPTDHNQVFMKFCYTLNIFLVLFKQKHIVPFLQEVFMPIVSTIFQVLLAPSDENDQVAATEKKMLQRGYFSFIANLVNNNVTEVLSNQGLTSVSCFLINFY